MNSVCFASALCGRGWHKAGFLLVLALFLKSSALGADGTVKGEVFIVTKGAANVRLGLVEILGFPEEVIQKHIAERNTHIKDEMPDFDGEIKRWDEFIAKLKTGSEKLKKLHEEKRQFNRRSGKVTSLTELREQREMIQRDEGSIAQLELEKKRSQEAKQNWPASKHFFKSLPEAKTSARTNSDGKFSLAVPKVGRVALVAQATRVTPESTERYYWMIWVSLEGNDSKEIILGNHNLMSAGSKESVVSTKSD